VVDPEPRPLRPRRPALLWLSISGVPNTILDSALRRFLLTSASQVVVLNGERAGYADAVRAIKRGFPTLKVLRYANAQRLPVRRVASTMYPHFLEHKSTQVLQVRRDDGSIEPRIGTDGTIWIDITSAGARAFIVSHLVEQVAAHGVDGVAIDSFHTDLIPGRIVDGEQKSSEWPGACEQILQALRAAMPDKQIWFNGLWPFSKTLLQAQSALLAFADGASMEFYGYDGRPNGTSNDFETWVARLNAVIAAHADKQILVRGTPAGDQYYDYRTDLRQARYCYGCYLLARTSRLSFSYGQSFQMTRLPKHRTGATSILSYFDLPLGEPIEPAAQNATGGWSRRYYGGAVFVAPASGPAQSWQATSDWWTTLGNRVMAGTSIALAPGDAAILLDNRPQPAPTAVDVDVAGSRSDSFTDGVSGEWLVQGVTGEYEYGRLILTLRSIDPDSAVLVRFETDDNDVVTPQRPFGILTILPEGGTYDPGNADYAYNQGPSLGAAHVTNGERYPTDGASHQMTVVLAKVCDPLPCFRVISVRAIGSVHVEGIRLEGPSPIAGL